MMRMIKSMTKIMTMATMMVIMRAVKTFNIVIMIMMRLR